MPTVIAITAADSASSMVAGKASAISVETLRPCFRLSPNSPCTALPTKAPNCTKKLLIQAELLAQRVALLLRRLLAEQIADRVADVLEQGKGDQCATVSMTTMRLHQAP